MGEAPESPRYEERYPNVMRVHLEVPEPGVSPSMSEKYGLLPMCLNKPGQSPSTVVVVQIGVATTDLCVQMLGHK